MIPVEDIEVHYLTNEDLPVLQAQALESCGESLADLKAQARLGRFSSEKAKHAWHVLKGLGLT